MRPGAWGLGLGGLGLGLGVLGLGVSLAFPLEPRAASPGSSLPEPQAPRPEPACPLPPGTPPPALAPRVARAVALARAVESSPAAPEPALRVHGGTLVELESLLYDVAVDPAWAQAYAAARGR